MGRSRLVRGAVCANPLEKLGFLELEVKNDDLHWFCLFCFRPFLQELLQLDDVGCRPLGN